MKKDKPQAAKEEITVHNICFKVPEIQDNRAKVAALGGIMVGAAVGYEEFAKMFSEVGNVLGTMLPAILEARQKMSEKDEG